MPPPSAVLQLESLMAPAAGLGLSWASKREALILDEKSAGQFASNADIEIEQLLRNGLAEQFPGQAVIGEEMGGALTGDARGWAIDPIDGTSNFVLGLPIWGISVGHWDNGHSSLGAIALPALGLTVSAAKGAGVRINGVPAGDLRPRSPVKIFAIGENDFETGPQTDTRAQTYRARDYSVVRYRCAVFALAMSGMGRLSGYDEHGCGLWDIAAADVICREAGMTVETRQINETRWSIKAQWPT
nr:inositol monophosphatase family protein [Hyphomonas sp. Mor2]